MAPNITTECLARAIRAWDRMTVASRLAIADRAYVAQPNLLGSFVALNRLGVSLEKTEFAMELFLIAFLAMEESSAEWPCVSEADQERACSRISGMALFSEGLPPYLQFEAAGQVVAQYREKVLLTYAISRVNEWLLEVMPEESDKYVVLAATSLAICLSSVKTRHRPATSETVARCAGKG